jgi:NADPH:quinone reductase-like Zn-dependent oxidoreductase
VQKIIIHKPGGYEQLCIEKHPDLTPCPGEVLIEVEAIGINYADCVTRMGLYASARQYIGYPITPGFEVAGRVAACGAGVDDLDNGTPVIGISRFGAYATQVAIPRQQVFTLPGKLSIAEGAGFPAVFLTAWYALFELAHPHSGDRILIHSAAGGVGGALVQLGKLAGCHVTGVVGAGHKTNTVYKSGADEVIDKSHQDLWQEANRISPDGYQVILDANGPSTLAQSYRHLAPMGKLVVYGFHGMLPRTGQRMNRIKLAWDYLRTPRFNPFRLTTENRGVLGFNLSFLFDQPAVLLEGMSQLLTWIDSGRISPPQLRTYPLNQVADAHRALESGQSTGKLVLVVP